MARSDVLVSADWAESNLDAANVVFVEVDEDTSAYDTDHLAGAIRLDWRTDLQDPVKRDFVDAQQFSKLLSDRGISNDDTVILYGGNNNWFAAGASLVGVIATAFALVAAFLNAAFGVCLGCQLYPLVARFRPTPS